MTLLFGQLDAFTCGQLLAMYEHRVFVQVHTSNVTRPLTRPLDIGLLLAQAKQLWLPVYLLSGSTRTSL